MGCVGHLLHVTNYLKLSNLNQQTFVISQSLTIMSQAVRLSARAASSEGSTGDAFKKACVWLLLEASVPCPVGLSTGTLGCSRDDSWLL